MRNSRFGGFLTLSSNALSYSPIHRINPFFTFLLSFPNSSFRPFSGYAVEQFSDDDYECDFETHKASSSVANIDEWKWKLSLLLRSEVDQEIVSKDRKDRRDYEQISSLAKRMGLYSELYGKVVVASKVPLPNYRPDLDDKRPQREVVVPLSLQRRVEGLLQEHLDRTRLNSREHDEGENGAKSVVDQAEEVSPDDNPDSFLDSSVMEKVLQRRSLRMRNMQRAWQESPEGKKMMDFRRSLPSFKEKEKLLQAIARNQVIVVSGETGCGKTTQLPQYILESEIESGRGAFCNIICTQPRRISAMSVSDRVSTERGEPLGESVGYKVRLEGVKGKNTHLLFCTSGILLRRLLSDRNLNGVTHVFVDEIHERGMNEDFLLIVLKDLLPRRQDLRLILMSATLNADLFSSYFGVAPKIHIPGFTYPVRTHFLEDVLEMTGYKLTSFNQIDDYGQDKMWKTQKQLAPRKKKNQITALVEDALHKSNFESYSTKTRDSLANWMPDCIGFNLIEAVLCHICRKERQGAVLVFMTGWEDISCLRDQLKAHPLLGDPNRVLLVTCHGSMATAEQKLIFERPPPNVRKIVLATNMAEASITINDIVFVVDCGKAKETTYDALNNTPCLLPSWISQASARQFDYRKQDAKGSENAQHGNGENLIQGLPEEAISECLWNLKYYLQMELAPSFLETTTACWDPIDSVFRFGNNELCPLFEEFSALLNVRFGRTIKVFSPTAEVRSDDRIMKKFNLSPKDTKLIQLTPPEYPGVCLDHALWLVKNTSNMKTWVPVMQLLILGCYFLEVKNEICNYRLVSFIPQLEKGASLVGAILDETLVYLSSTHTGGSFTSKGSQLLLQIWLMEKLKCLQDPDVNWDKYKPPCFTRRLSPTNTSM